MIRIVLLTVFLGCLAVGFAKEILRALLTGSIRYSSADKLCNKRFNSSGYSSLIILSPGFLVVVLFVWFQAVTLSPAPRLDSPKQNRQGQDFSYTVLHEGTVNFDSSSCQLRKFAPVDFDSSRRSSVTLVPGPNTLSVTISDPHPSTVTLRIVFRNA